MEDTQPFRDAYELVNQGEHKLAVKVARATAASLGKHWSVAIPLGGILIDAGTFLKNRRLVKEGIKLIEDASSSASGEFKADAYYNAGTGYATLGQMEPGTGPGTRPSLFEAVNYLNQSLQIRPTADTHTNFASTLLDQGRWVEACDELRIVLAENPSHHVALARQADSFIEIFNWSQRHRGFLVAALANYRKSVEESKAIPLYNRYYLERAQKLEAKLTEEELAALENVSLQPATGVEEWIIKNRLALNMCPHCNAKNPDAFDTAIVGGVVKTNRRHPTVTELYDLVNTLHRSFSTARWCLLQGAGVVDVNLPKQVLIVPGSPSAHHDLKTGLVISALSGFYSILDQIAYALNSYLHLGHAEEQVSLAQIWRPQGDKKRGIPRSRSELHSRFRRFAVPPISALYQLALSLERGRGIYAELREKRNHFQHHAVVITTDNAPSRYFKSMAPATLVETALKTGRIAKAAIIYFGASIWFAEGNRMNRAERRGIPIIQGKGTRVRRI